VRVAQGAARFALFAVAARDTVAIKDRLRTLQQPILKIIESAHARHVVRREATQQRTKGLFPQARDPEIAGGDVTFQHHQPGPQQIIRGACGAPVLEGIEPGQDGLGCREIGMAKLTPQGGGIVWHLDRKHGAAALDKFEVLAVGP
jgi:hypothetical protein